LDGERQNIDDPSGFGGEPGAYFQKDIFESEDVEVEGRIIKTYPGSIHGDSEELVNIKKKQGKSDVIPTLPKLENNK
jgi:hypothetical protein